MTWSDFYLFCFLVGFSLSVVSFLAGAVHIHLPVKWHLPFHLGHHWGGGHGGVRGAFNGGAEISWFNASTIMAFLAWVGEPGNILIRNARLPAFVLIGISM